MTERKLPILRIHASDNAYIFVNVDRLFLKAFLSLFFAARVSVTGSSMIMGNRTVATKKLATQHMAWKNFCMNPASIRHVDVRETGVRS